MNHSVSFITRETFEYVAGWRNTLANCDNEQALALVTPYQLSIMLKTIETNLRFTLNQIGDDDTGEPDEIDEMIASEFASS